jgi:uncharacterized XkdX family phage protein
MSISVLASIDWYSTILKYYQDGYYSKDDVATYVYYQKITPAQYKTITGEDYLVYLQNAYKAGKKDQAYLQSCVTKGLITQAEYNIIIAS